MGEYRLGVIEQRFADLIWENEPITSAELVKLAEQELSWKKSTTYTILRRLSEKGLFKNENSIVTSLVSRWDFYAAQSTGFIEETFGGSLPRFLTAFASRKKLSDKEIEALKKLIEESQGG